MNNIIAQFKNLEITKKLATIHCFIDNLKLLNLQITNIHNIYKYLQIVSVWNVH